MRREARQPRRAAGGRLPAGELVDRPHEQRVDPERRDERRDPELRDRQPAEQPRRDAGENDEQDRHRQQRVGSAAVLRPGMLRDDDRRQQDHARHREVETTLLDHERLADRCDREHRRERQHREQRTASEAVGCKQRADGEQQRRRRTRSPSSAAGAGARGPRAVCAEAEPAWSRRPDLTKPSRRPYWAVRPPSVTSVVPSMSVECAQRAGVAADQPDARTPSGSADALPPIARGQMAAAMPDRYWRPPSRIDANALSSSANVPVSRRR